MQSKAQLTVLFEADFSDGTTYHQDADDTSVNYPPDADGNGKSAFSDVLDRIDDVIAFHLVRKLTAQGEELGKPFDRTTVDLKTGIFVVNGQEVSLHDDLEITAPLKLVFYRKGRVESVVGMDKEVLSQRHYIHSTHIGWQMIGKDGKNVTHVLAVH